jgi:hypothetical protein
MDEIFGYLLKKLNAVPSLSERLNIIVVSDHGMASLENESTIVLKNHLPNLEDWIDLNRSIFAEISNVYPRYDYKVIMLNYSFRSNYIK